MDEVPLLNEILKKVALVTSVLNDIERTIIVQDLVCLNHIRIVDILQNVQFSLQMQLIVLVIFQCILMNDLYHALQLSVNVNCRSYLAARALFNSLLELIDLFNFVNPPQGFDLVIVKVRQIVYLLLVLIENAFWQTIDLSLNFLNSLACVARDLAHKLRLLLANVLVQDIPAFSTRSKSFENQFQVVLLVNV